MKVPFNELFTTTDDGAVTPRRPLRVRDTELPAGEPLQASDEARALLRAATLGGLLDVHEQDDMLVISLDAPGARLDPAAMRALLAATADSERRAAPKESRPASPQLQRTQPTGGFLPGARVKLVNWFDRPYENAVATARTCYSSKGIITTEEVSGDELDATKPREADQKEQRIALRDRIAGSVYQAGHHTTLQHAHFQFAIEGVSRQFLWAFLHTHPYYNSEQVSQRYVAVKPDAVVVPPLNDAARATYRAGVHLAMEAYQELCTLLAPAVEAAYLARFPARKGSKVCARDVKKKSQEVARYVLPLGTQAYLYHTISSITLMRYYRCCEQLDAPAETKAVVHQMVDAVREIDPLFDTVLEDPLPLEETHEYAMFQSLGLPVDGAPSDDVIAQRREFIAEFDDSLDGRVSKLLTEGRGHSRILASAVREVLGVPRSTLSDEAAIAAVLDPASNRLLGETMRLTSLAKLARPLHHASWSFRKKLSHTADSQDQRHRTTPGSRPVLMAHFTGDPDYITPPLIDAAGGTAAALYHKTMESLWAAATAMLAAGAPSEFAAYVLPNAVAVRFTESGDLVAMQHKLTSRLCWNAQEEIWRASVDEWKQISGLDPSIGRHLGPPCVMRDRAKRSPKCPEGDRYCGVPVWRDWDADTTYDRTI